MAYYTYVSIIDILPATWKLNTLYCNITMSISVTGTMNMLRRASVLAVLPRKTPPTTRGVSDGRTMVQHNVTIITSYVSGCVRSCDSIAHKTMLLHRTLVILF